MSTSQITAAIAAATRVTAAWHQPETDHIGSLAARFRVSDDAPSQGKMRPRYDRRVREATRRPDRSARRRNA